MDKLKNNNKEHAVIAAIECPYNNAADAAAAAAAAAADVDVESNKSTPTPYFTPLDFLQTSFEFPSPTGSGTGTGTGSGVGTSSTEEEAATYTNKHFTIANNKTQQLPQSPTTLNRKFKRFSLYDRRSCSPQQDGRIVANNKENTVPKQGNSDNDHNDSNLYLSKSEHNSPTILFRDESGAGTAANSNSNSNTNYSPKLLASLNNLNLNQSLSGSPLNIINSAGYKNGNFFRFPEIDQDVAPAAEQSKAAAATDQQQQQQPKQRKNKNNLTIRITDTVSCCAAAASSAAVVKPKTPTIKSTKEKARSLDSAANETELSLLLQHRNEIDDKMQSNLLLLQPSAASLHCTSLNRLDSTQQQLQQQQLQLQQQSSLHTRRLVTRQQRKSPNWHSSNSDWLNYQRKQRNLDADELKMAPRSAHKLNPLLHASSNNLKTLPECLTLVEFTKETTAAGAATPNESPFKQKSMDLPAKSMNNSMNLLQRRGSNHSLTLNLHSSCGNLLHSGLSVSNYSLGNVSNSKSSCNLEQQQQQPQQLPQQQQQQQQLSVGKGLGLFRRRGSNHCLTLKNHTTNSCGELNAMATTPKRGLLERRGSNQSLTLNMNAEQPKLTVCNCSAVNAAAVAAASNATNATQQRKFFSTENLHLKQTLCFGSASDLQPGMDLNTTAAENHCSCNSSAATGIRNIMTRPLSPQTTSEEFKIYLASIQMLQSASNPLNQFDLIKLNHVFDSSYQLNVQQPPVLVLERVVNTGLATPLPQLPPTSEDSELLALYQSVVQRICRNQLPHLLPDEQKRIFRDLHKEFWDLPLNHQEKPMVFGSQTKNRYKTILPNDHSRVILESEASELLELKQQHQHQQQQQQQQQCSLLPDPTAMTATATATATATTTTLLPSEDLPYINANYIKGPDYVSKCYIASQGPLPNTIFEFWLMVYQNTQRYIRRCLDGGGSSSSPHVDKSQILQQYYQKIVMLTNFTEAGRQKCAIYFPIELNELFAVAAKEEVFQLTTQAREYFEPYLLANSVNQMESSSLEGGAEQRWHIAVESTRVTLTEALRQTLPADGSFFLVKNVGIVRRNGYSVRKLVLLYCLNVPESAGRVEYYLQKICCYHYWYPDWPDHHSPRDINTLLDTCLHVLNLGKCESEFHNFEDDAADELLHLNAQRLEIYKQDIFNAVQPLPIIHCSAGIGRTGCFTAILNAVRQLRQSLAYSLTGMLSSSLSKSDIRETPTIAALADTESSFSCNTILYIRHIVEPTGECIGFDQLPKMPDIYVDILGIVCNLRLQRGGMVQNSEQYELIHRAICLYLKRTLALRRF